MAWSGKKAPIIKKAVEGEISGDVPATYLQLSDHVDFVLDEAAASELTRFDTPWLVKDCVWENNLKEESGYLAGTTTVKKPILKLTEEDYNNHGMAQLAVEQGPVYNINIDIFNQVQHTLLPAGRSMANLMPMTAKGLNRRIACQKTFYYFLLPHPDDDVISLGGTFIRLVDQGHDVHVAYQTSGNTAVWDDDVLRYMEFTIDFNGSIGEDNTHLKEHLQ